MLATRLSNQVTSSHHIMTWHYDAVFVQQKRSLFHQGDQLMSRIVYSRDKQKCRENGSHYHCLFSWGISESVIYPQIINVIFNLCCKILNNINSDGSGISCVGGGGTNLLFGTLLPKIG